MANKIVPVCWYDEETGKTVCGFADSVTGQRVSAPEPTTTVEQLSPSAAQTAASTVSQIASLFPQVQLFMTGISALVALGIEVAPYIKNLFSGKEISVEDQAKIKEFIDSIEARTVTSGDEWKQD